MTTIEYLPHTADVRIRVTADTVEELFAIALKGMNDILKVGECEKHSKGLVRESIHIRSHDVTTLLVDFMNQVLALSYAHRAVFCFFWPERLVDGDLVAFLRGVEVTEFDEDVKAVTYHEAEVRVNREGRLETTIVLDI